jgi:hypothetical protein
LWLVGEWTELDFPSFPVSAGGELQSRIGGVRGASPADVSSAMVRSFAAQIFAFVRQDFS